MTYKEALDILTDWFDSYRDDNNVLVHCRHITEEYKEAKAKLDVLVAIADNKVFDAPKVERNEQTDEDREKHAKQILCEAYESAKIAGNYNSITFFEMQSIKRFGVGIEDLVKEKQKDEETETRS